MDDASTSPIAETAGSVLPGRALAIEPRPAHPCRIPTPGVVVEGRRGGSAGAALTLPGSYWREEGLGQNEEWVGSRRAPGVDPSVPRAVLEEGRGRPCGEDGPGRLLRFGGRRGRAGEEEGLGKRKGFDLEEDVLEELSFG